MPIVIAWRTLLTVLAAVAATSLSAPAESNAASRRALREFPAVGVSAGGELETWSASSVAHQFRDYVSLRARWVRHDFAWDAIEPHRGTFRWSGFDRLVAAARARGRQVLATVTYTPAWANGGHADHDYRPASSRQFGRFAGRVAARYAPRGVHAYEVWNEPNIGFWQPVPSPAAYAKVLCAAYRAIHAADPHATVITGGSSPAGDGPATYSPQTWLTDLYVHGAGKCFDAVGHHPYVDDTISAPRRLGNAWNLMSAAYPPSNLRAIMAAHGDSGKRIWATEVGCTRWGLGDAECARRLELALRAWRAYPWAGVLCWFTYWDPNAYGLVDGTWARRPEWFAFRRSAVRYP